MKSIVNNTYYIKLPNELLNKVSNKKDRYYLILFLQIRAYKQSKLPTGIFNSSSYDSLAKELNIGRTTFDSVLRELDKRSYIIKFKKGFKLNGYTASIKLNFPDFNLFSKKNQKRKFYSFQQINLNNASELLQIHKDALFQYSLMYQTINRYTFTNRNDKRKSKDSAENVNGQMLSLEKIKQLMFHQYSKSQISKLNYKIAKTDFLTINRSTREVDLDKYMNSGSSKYFLKNGKAYEWLCNRYVFNLDLKTYHSKKKQLRKPIANPAKVDKKVRQTNYSLNQVIDDFFFNVDVKRKLMSFKLIKDMTRKVGTRSYNRIISDILSKKLINDFVDLNIEQLVPYVEGYEHKQSFMYRGSYIFKNEVKYRFTYKKNPPSHLINFWNDLKMKEQRNVEMVKRNEESILRLKQIIEDSRKRYNSTSATSNINDLQYS